MSLQKPASKRRFTPAALAAAIEARRRKREAAVPRTMPEVYVVRVPGSHLPFGWEIRRFGALVLDRSHTGYATLQDARTAGEDILADRRAEA